MGLLILSIRPTRPFLGHFSLWKTQFSPVQDYFWTQSLCYIYNNRTMSLPSYKCNSLCIMGPLMMSIRPKCLFCNIFGSGRPNSHWFRIIFGHNACDTYTMIGQYHYPHIKVTFCANGPSNTVHQANKAIFGKFLALEDPILTGLGLLLDTVLVLHI